MSSGNEPTRIAATGPASPSPDPAPVSDGLQFLDLIGKGGFGAVYRAADDRLGRVVAAKVLHDGGTGRQRFLAEAMITGNLQHPHIIPVHSLAVDQRGRDYFTMPVIQGRSLGEVIRQLVADDPATVAKYTLPRLISILVAVGDAVAYAHARGVVHRDLKPQNIMLGSFGEVFVLDWGIAKLMHQPADQARPNGVGSGARHHAGPIDADTIPTIDGAVIGTPGYMSPEQARGETEAIGFASDIYSLGIILFQLLTLQLPVSTSTAATALLATSEGRLRNAPTVAGRRQVPKALAAVSARAMACDPAARYPTAAALVADLRAWLEDREVEAYPDGPVQRSWRWLRRHRVAAALIGGSLASAAAAGVAILALASGHNAERARLAEAAQAAAERASAAEHGERERLERRASAFRAYLPGIEHLQRAELNPVWAERAVATFDRALAADPDFAEAHRGRARALELAGHYREAIAAYERALQLSRAALGSDDPALLRDIGLCLWNRLQDIRGASEWLRRAAAADPANPNTRVVKALVRSIDGDNPAAIAEMRQVAGDAPDRYEIHAMLGQLLIGASPLGGRLTMNGGPNGVTDPKEAEVQFSEAIRLHPGIAKYHVYRGLARSIQYTQGDRRQDLLDGALADFDAAVALEPDNLNAHTVRLDANSVVWREAVVKQELVELKRRWPTHPQALQTRAKYEIPAGRGGIVLAEVEAALAAEPGSEGLRQLRDKLRAALDAKASAKPKF